MAKIILGTFLAALALFFWGFIYFGISGVPFKILGPGTDATAVFLKENLPEDGIYIFPNPTSENAHELMARGPVATVHIQRDGFDGNMGMMVGGFLHGWGYCLLLALLLKQICKKTGYCGRVGFVLLVGVTGSFLARFGDAIWWHHSWTWQVSNFAYTVIGTIIVGFILAKFIPQEKQ